MAKKTIEDIQVNGKKELVRCDFNVPMDENKVITDENRLRGALPTIKYLMEHGAKVILCSHLGRPKGEFNMKYSLRPVAERLSQLVEALVVDYEGQEIRYTISLGVASCVPSGDEGPELLVSMADALLYEAKAHGRDRVEG